MTAEILYAKFLQYEKVAYYTVQVNNRPTSEFEDFFNRLNDESENKLQLGIINRRIMQMGKVYGADKKFFNKEAITSNRPLPNFEFIKSDSETDLCVRLYCVRLDDHVVVLLNGGCKTVQNIQDCKNCRPHFELAAKISDAILLANKQNKIGVDGMELLIEEDFLLEL